MFLKEIFIHPSNKKNNSRKARNPFFQMGMGVALGIAVGVALKNIAIGLAVGIIIGGIGVIISRSRN